MLTTPKPGTEDSGSDGGITFTTYRGASVLRGRTHSVAQPNAMQNNRQAKFRRLAARWRDVVTPVQQAAWDVYAGLSPIVHPVKGNVFLSGYAMYQRCNLPRIDVSVPFLPWLPPSALGIKDAPPAAPGHPVLSPTVVNMTWPIQPVMHYDPASPWIFANQSGVLAAIHMPHNRTRTNNPHTGVTFLVYFRDQYGNLRAYRPW